jgi:Golgi apparatus protein 1
MQRRRHEFFQSLPAFTISLLALLAGPAKAETQFAKDAIAKAEAAVAQLKTACAPDVKSYCSTVTPGEGRLALCMMAHEDKISDACYDAMLTVAEGVDLAVSKVQRAAVACASDIDRSCATVDAGEGRLVQCLIDKKAELSAPCRAEVTDLEARAKK